MTEEERELQELKKQLSGLTKVLSKSNKAVLEGTRSSTQFNNVKKALNQTMAGYRKRVKETGNKNKTYVCVKYSITKVLPGA